jgi:hypothetical protein
MGVSKRKRGRLPIVSDWDTPRFLLRDAATAAGISVGLLKAWVSREPKVIHFGSLDRSATGRGTPRLLTLRRVVCIALAAELVSLGFTASRAGSVASTFTDSEDPPIEWPAPGFLIVPPATDDIFLVGEGLSIAQAFKVTAGDATSYAVISCAALLEKVRSLVPNGV